MKMVFIDRCLAGYFFLSAVKDGRSACNIAEPEHPIANNFSKDLWCGSPSSAEHYPSVLNNVCVGRPVWVRTILNVYPFTSKSDQFQTPLQPHQKYYITQYEELGFSTLTQMKDDYASNSHYLIHTFPFIKGWEDVLFELGSKRVNWPGTLIHLNCTMWLL